MSLYSVLKDHAFKKLIPVSLGWCAVALLESLSYIAIACAILKLWPSELIIILGILTVISTSMVTNAGFHTGAKLAGSIYNIVSTILSRIKVTWFTTHNRSQLLKLNTQHIPGFMSIPAHQLQNFIHAPLVPIIITLALFWIVNYQVGLLFASLLCLSLFLQYRAQQALAKTDQQRNQTEVEATHAALELVEYLELLRSAGGCKNATTRVEQAWSAQSIALFKTNTAAALATFCSAIAVILPCLGALLFLYLTDVKQHEFYLVVMLLALRATFPIEALALAALSLNDQYAAYKNYREILNAPTLPEPDSIQQVLAENYTVSIENISYPPIFNDFSCIINQGTRVLINGASGKGKTTLLHLLMRFDDPKHGDVKIGKTSLKTIPLPQRASFFAYVPQVPVIFSGTIASNIRISKPDASDQEVEQIARAMMLGNLLDRSPLGINQTVGEYGAALSGGERQRLALAQAIIKNAPIVILDEATSALDPQTEASIIKQLQELKCTLLVVTHNSSDIWKPEHIIHLP